MGQETPAGVLGNGMCEIRWHGRGGQGAVSSAKILATAAYLAGFPGVTSAPSFGAERRGAPVTASTRMAADPIRVFSQVETPDVVVVLDDSLLKSANATAGMKPGAWLIINSRLAPEDIGLSGDFRIATADASGAAVEAGLIVQGAAMVNTPMLGAIARATGLVSLDNIQAALDEAFPAKHARRNFDAARLTYERTKC